MNDTNLEKLIAESIAKREADETAYAESVAKQESEYEDLLAKATEERLKEIADLLPRELHPYCAATDGPPGDLPHRIKTLREGWRPEYFDIRAPGLSTIFFTTHRDWNAETKALGPPYIYRLATSDQHSDDHRKWYQAIAEAARLRVEYDEFNAREAERDERINEQQRLLAQARAEAVRPPTTFERLEALIREIAREEINQAQTEDF